MPVAWKFEFNNCNNISQAIETSRVLQEIVPALAMVFLLFLTL